MRPRAAAVGAALILAVSCGGSGSPASEAPSSPSSALSATGSSAPPVSMPIPSPSGAGFCTDRAVVDQLITYIKTAGAPYRQIVVRTVATAGVVRADIPLAPTSVAAVKTRGLAITLDTLAAAVKGSVENYPDDFSVRAYVQIVPARARKLSLVSGCGP